MQLIRGETIKPGTLLTQDRFCRLLPWKKFYDVRDDELRKFGIRILPSGRKRYFLHQHKRGARVWHTIGGACTMTEARSRAAIVLASARTGEA